MWSHFSRSNTSRQSASSVCGHSADGQFQSVVCCESVRGLLLTVSHPNNPGRTGNSSGVFVCLERAFYFINLEPVNFAHCGVGDMLGHGSGISGGKHQPLRAH